MELESTEARRLPRSRHTRLDECFDRLAGDTALELTLFGTGGDGRNEFIDPLVQIPSASSQTFSSNNGSSPRTCLGETVTQRDTAIDGERLTGHVGGLIRSQERDGGGYVFWQT